MAPITNHLYLTKLISQIYLAESEDEILFRDNDKMSKRQNEYEELKHEHSALLNSSELEQVKHIKPIGVSERQSVKVFLKRNLGIFYPWNYSQPILALYEEAEKRIREEVNLVQTVLTSRHNNIAVVEHLLSSAQRFMVQHTGSNVISVEDADKETKSNH